MNIPGHTRKNHAKQAVIGKAISIKLWHQIWGKFSIINPYEKLCNCEINYLIIITIFT
jgi:hypothetical protein